MWVWIVVAVVVLAVIAAVWIGNTVRWTKRNNNLARRSPKLFGRSGPQVDERNRTRPETDPSRRQP
jgi:uncharacterized membrane protein